jgi:hypothetical protein
VQGRVRLEVGGHGSSIEFDSLIVPPTQKLVDKRPRVVVHSKERAGQPWQFAVHPGHFSRHDQTLSRAARSSADPRVAVDQDAEDSG